MNILRLSFSIVIVYIYCLPTTPHQQEPHNITLWAKSRQKRFLVFQNAGVSKYIVNLAMPVDLHDRRPWRALSCAWNFQWQHNLPLTPIHWWNSTYFPVKGRSFIDGAVPGPPQPIDLTAIFLYAMIETYMNNKGMNGRECMQRAICENAQVHHVGGLFDKIYKRLLTPEKTMEEYYKDSYTLGAKGVDCNKIYFRCPKGESFFDHFVQIENMK